MSKLSKLSVAGGTWIPGEKVLHVSDPHTLSQAAGYLKYIFRKDGPVYFRGQGSLYPSLYPSLHRGIKKTSGLKNREAAFGKFLREARANSSFLAGTADYTHAPILQHYGISTKWLDLVDNVWVALWFACHKARALGRHSEYLHFEQRKRPYPDSGTQEFAYILLVNAGQVDEVVGSPGLLRGPEADIIDLRVAAPSVYLRPHAQHGLLIRRRNGDTLPACDLQPLVVGAIRVEIGDALSWLGQGELLSVHSLFPPPHYDFGYRQLLTNIPDRQPFLGAIHHVGA